MTLKKAIGQAVGLYESFRDASPRKVASVRVNIPKAAAVIGYVEAVDYRTTHAGKVTLYRHDFAPGSRPLLAASADGAQLLLLGGRYKFTEQGIVDKDARGKLITNPKHGKNINPRKGGKLARFLQGKPRKQNARRSRATIDGMTASDAEIVRHVRDRELAVFEGMRRGTARPQDMPTRTAAEVDAFRRYERALARIGSQST